MPEPTAGAWFTSSYSNDGNACVEVRFDGAEVLLADSKQRGTGPVIRLDGPTWDAFVAAALAALPTDGAPQVTAAPHGGRTVAAADGTALHFTAAEWSAFLAGAAAGEFRRPLVAAVGAAPAGVVRTAPGDRPGSLPSPHDIPA